MVRMDTIPVELLQSILLNDSLLSIYSYFLLKGVSRRFYQIINTSWPYLSFRDTPAVPTSLLKTLLRRHGETMTTLELGASPVGVDVLLEPYSPAFGARLRHLDISDQPHGLGLHARALFSLFPVLEVCCRTPRRD